MYAFGGCQAALCYLDAYVKITDAWRFAGETPALFAEQSAFGGCQAALRSPKQVEKVTDDWRFAGETPALRAAQCTPSGWM